MHSTLIYEGATEGIFVPEAFERYITTDLQVHLGKDQIDFEVHRHYIGSIIHYGFLPIGVNVLYEQINGHVVIGAAGNNRHTLDRVVEAITTAHQFSLKR